jgi:hypothetical protein
MDDDSFTDDWREPESESRLAPWERMEKEEVLEALFRGESFSRVARLANVQVSYVRRWMKKLPLERLMDMEAKRVMAHMAGRDLSPEKYLALSTALGNLIDKVRLLRDEPTEILERRDTGKFERIAAAIQRRTVELRRGQEGDRALYGPEPRDAKGLLGGQAGQGDKGGEEG